jgi:basic membrane protein A
MKRNYRVLTLFALVSLVAAACGSKPSNQGTGGTAPSKFLACQVTDTGGIDDRSFNATAWKGMQDAQSQLGVQVKFLESTSSNDFTPNLQTFVQQKCGLIVTVGFLLGDATKASATANANQKYAIVDFAYDPPLPNVLGLTFSTDQAAFLAGYVAAGMSKTLRRAEDPDRDHLHGRLLGGDEVLQPEEQRQRAAGRLGRGEAERPVHR